MGWTQYKTMVSPESGITWQDGACAELALSFGKTLGPRKDKDIELLMEGSETDGGLVTKKYDHVWMNERWMDIGLTWTAI